MTATQTTNRRNGPGGIKLSSDRYRHFNGELFIAWLIYPSTERVSTYRAAGVRCRRIKEDLYINEDDKDLALQIDKAHNFN